MVQAQWSVKACSNRRQDIGEMFSKKKRLLKNLQCWGSLQEEVAFELEFKRQEFVCEQWVRVRRVLQRVVQHRAGIC